MTKLKKILTVMIVLCIVISMGIMEANAEGGANVTANGKTNNFKLGDIFYYNYALEVTDEKILNLQSNLTWDSSILKLIVTGDDEVDAKALFPVVGTDMIANIAYAVESGKMIGFNFSTINGYYFPSGSHLVEAKFEIIGEGDVTIDNGIKYMQGYGDGIQEVSIIYKDEVLIKDIIKVSQGEVVPENPKTIPVVGDADNDGDVSIKDVTAIQKHIATIASLEIGSVGYLAADADNDAAISIKDVTAIQKYIATIPTNTDIGKERYYSDSKIYNEKNI